jgi:CheY-like chemotaxis protein
MNKNGPVIIIEDDPDDQDILAEIFRSLNYPNKILYFADGEQALAYINKSDVVPFLILSDINMPRLDGFELKRRIVTNAALQIKCIPFLFFTTAVSRQAVIDAYSASVQGFFIKENSLAELEMTIRSIVEYWKRCYSPNQYHEVEGMI